MDNFGFIHGELDTKILILFILRRLPRPVDADTLAELCFCDTGVSWFDYSQLPSPTSWTTATFDQAGEQPAT